MSLGDNWGATAAETATPLPCDALLPGARFRAHRAASVEAEPAVTFRWLCQLRRAPYSYDILDNLGRRSPRRLTPGLDRLEPGQRFMSIFRLSSFDRNEQVTLLTGNVNTAVTYAVRPDTHGSRLLVRVLFRPGSPLLTLLTPPLMIGDLVMMRKQLLNLRELAESRA